MGKVLRVYVDDDTLARMQHFVKDIGASEEWLAETAVAEYVLDAWKKEGCPLHGNYHGKEK
jgi:predicted transcriptional regulator